MSSPASCRSSVIKGKRRGGDPSAPPPLSIHSPGAATMGANMTPFLSERAACGHGGASGSGCALPLLLQPVSPIHFSVCVCVRAQRGIRHFTYTLLSHFLFIVWGRMSLQLQGRGCQEDGEAGRISEILRAALDGFWGRGGRRIQT